jgi:hypothetical protein
MGQARLNFPGIQRREVRWRRTIQSKTGIKFATRKSSVVRQKT